MQATHDVVVVGGGAAGISVAARLLNERPSLDVAVIDGAQPETLEHTVHVAQEPGIAVDQRAIQIEDDEAIAG